MAGVSGLLCPSCGKLWDMAADDPTPETRTSLIRRVCALDPESWTEFVRLYDTLLQAYIASCNQRSQLALDDTDREDIKQEVLIRLYHKLPSFKTDMRFRTWLWPVTHNIGHRLGTATAGPWEDVGRRTRPAAGQGRGDAG